MYIRRAKLEDEKDVFDWRNDPDTISQSLGNTSVSWENHVAWYRNILKNPLSFLYIGLVENFKIGVVRFDIGSGSAEISINLNPKCRGLGYGKELLRLTCHDFRLYHGDLVLTAKAKLKNQASKKCFLYNKFEVVKTNNDLNFFEKLP